MRLGRIRCFLMQCMDLIGHRTLPQHPGMVASAVLALATPTHPRKLGEEATRYAQHVAKAFRLLHLHILKLLNVHPKETVVLLELSVLGKMCYLLWPDEVNEEVITGQGGNVGASWCKQHAISCHFPEIL